MPARNPHASLSLEALRVCIAQAGSNVAELEPLHAELRRRVLSSKRSLALAQELLESVEVKLTSKAGRRTKTQANARPSHPENAPRLTSTELRQVARHLKAMGFEDASVRSIDLLPHATKTTILNWFRTERARLQPYEAASRGSSPRRSTNVTPTTYASIATTLAAEDPAFAQILATYSAKPTDLLLASWNNGKPKGANGRALTPSAKRALAIVLRERLRLASEA